MIRHILTAQDSHARLQEQAPLPLCPPQAASADTGISLWVEPERRFQTIEGFGGAFTEAAAHTWLGLPEPQRQQVLHDYFSPGSGHGYTFCRVHMNSCDFSLGNYAHAAIAEDYALEHFSIARDQQALLPLIKAALQTAARPIRLLASPWSPPAWMKTTGQMNHGGGLKPECANAWARCYVRYIQAYAAEGVPIWGVSVQNEPAANQTWDSCLYSAEEERDFVRDHLGPELAQAGLGHIRIVIWDHNRDRMVERAATAYADPQAAQYIWGTGFHWYGENHFDHVQLVHDAWPDKKLLFTEGCQEGGPHQGNWAVGERYARSIINDLNRWTVGWIDWNLLLNAQGGPNHVGNLCSAPLLTSADGQRIEHQTAYYYLGHFARFVQPGAQRILCAATHENLETTAWRNPNGDTVCVALNRSAQPIHFSLRMRAGHTATTTTLPAHAIATYLSTGTS
jgi:glucosylceramidase